MSRYIAETLKENIYKEQLLLEKQAKEENEKRLFNKKHEYVVMQVIPFLSKEYSKCGYEFEPLMAKMQKEDYLNELIREAHAKHYINVCSHHIDFNINFGTGCFIDQTSIYTCNGWIKAPDDIWGRTSEPCCNKSYATGVSVNILEFDNSEHFNLDNKNCICIHSIQIN